MDFGEGAVDRRTWDELPTRKLMVVDSRHHHHHRSTVTSEFRSALVWVPVFWGTLPALAPSVFTVTTKLVLFLNPLSL